MNIHVDDFQVVAELEGTLFTMTQQSPVSAAVTIRNTGTNTINYRFQEIQNDGTWADLTQVSPANDLNSTLQAGQNKVILVGSNFSQVRLVGNASGGAEVFFSVTRIHSRASGGPLPILSL